MDAGDDTDPSSFRATVNDLTLVDCPVECQAIVLESLHRFVACEPIFAKPTQNYFSGMKKRLR